MTIKKTNKKWALLRIPAPSVLDLPGERHREYAPCDHVEHDHDGEGDHPDDADRAAAQLPRAEPLPAVSRPLGSFLVSNNFRQAVAQGQQQH